MTHGSTGTAAAALQVLVVDDSQAQRTRVRSALEGAGLTVVGEAEDGAQALSEAAAHHPDVVLMDLRMPRMDGVQATRILRRQQPDTPVVLWTGDDDAQLERAVSNSGAQVGIPKDIGTGELVATLQDACTAQDEARPVAGGHPDSGVEASVEGLTAADWAALKQLEATHGYAMRWSVGRQVGRSLVNLAASPSAREVMRSSGAVRLNTGVRESPQQAENVLVRRAVQAQRERGGPADLVADQRGTLAG